MAIGPPSMSPILWESDQATTIRAEGEKDPLLTPAKPTAKEEMLRVLQAQPDDSSYDELLRELVFAGMIERGLADSDAGRTISHEEMGHRLATWSKGLK